MNLKIETAMEEVGITYDNIVSIADKVLANTVKNADRMIASLKDNLFKLSTSQLRENILSLQIESYILSDFRANSGAKAIIASSLLKEKEVLAFNQLEGTVAFKERNAAVAVSDSIVVQIIYNLIADKLKNKVDELHRMIDSLKSVLMSLMQEAKLDSLSNGTAQNFKKPEQEDTDFNGFTE